MRGTMPWGGFPGEACWPAFPVSESLTKADIFHAHLVERPERPHSLFKAVVAAAQKIVCLFQTFNAHADADVGELFGKLDGTFDPPAACAYHDARRLGEHHFNDRSEQRRIGKEC